MNRDVVVERGWKRLVLADLFFVLGLVVISSLVVLGLDLSIRFAFPSLASACGLKNDTVGTVTAPRRMALDEALLASQSRETVFIDARPPAFFAEGHIPGALNIPRATSDKLLPQIRQRLAKTQSIVVYCASQDCKDSLAVAEKLTKAGYQKVKIFSGGWEEWSAAGLPTEK